VEDWLINAIGCENGRFGADLDPWSPEDAKGIMSSASAGTAERNDQEPLRSLGLVHGKCT
jgi:hypothetical protein